MINYLCTLGLLATFVFQPLTVEAQIPGPDNNAIVASVNGITISAAEFQWRMQQMRGSCFDFFLQKNQASGNGPGYWQKNFEGNTPVHWLKIKTLFQVADDKVKLQIMQQYGVLEGFDHNSFLESLKQENKRRQQTLEAGGVIFGMQVFDEGSLYAYIYSNALLKTQEKILEAHPPTNSALQRYYEMKKKALFKIPPTIIVTMMCPDSSQSDNKTGLQTFLQQENSGDTPLSVSEHNTATNTTLSFTPDSRKTDEIKWPAALQHAQLFTSPGQESSVFTDDTNRHCRLVCDSIIQNGYQSFEEVRGVIANSLAEMEFNRRFNAAQKQAVMKIFPKAWAELHIE